MPPNVEFSRKIAAYHCYTLGVLLGWLNYQVALILSQPSP